MKSLHALSAVLTAVGLVAGVASAQARAGLDGATITNSGSTNAPGYTIRLRSDGSAAYSTRSRMVTAMAKSGSVPVSLAARFFADLKAARRAAPTSERACMKSASFGSTTTVQWHGWTSGDLECPGGSQALKVDIDSLKTALGIDSSPGADRP